MNQTCDNGNIVVTATPDREGKDGKLTIFVKNKGISETLCFSDMEERRMIKACYLDSKQISIRAGFAVYGCGDLCLSFGDDGINMGWRNGAAGDLTWTCLNSIVNYLFTQMAINRESKEDSCKVQKIDFGLVAE